MASESERKVSLRTFTPLEARVLGVLVEKQATVPDSYPLSLNTLTLGCNQKTARDPVMNATEAEVLSAADSLKAMSLVFEGSGSRVVRFEHNLGRVLGVPSQSVALLGGVVLAQVLVRVGGRGLAGVRAVLVHEDAGEEPRVGGRVGGQRGEVALGDRHRGFQLVEVDDLVQVGDEGVRQQDDR